MKRILSAVIILIIVATFGCFYFLKTSSKPVSSSTSNVMFIIKNGESLVNISKDLKSKSLVRNQYCFLFYAYKLGLNKKIQAGTFRLNPSLSTKEIVVKLSQGGVSDYWLKIIDGTRVEENIDSFPKDTDLKGLEGYLYPDSYLIPTYYTGEQIIEVIQENFDQKFAKVKEGATNTKLTDKQILVLASIIEHEARTLKVKQGVSGVLMNRLNIDMPLQSDVTVQYARDSKNKPTKYWKDLDVSDISIVSPYNTYKNTGLPPGPICNPGYDSIYAAFHPTESDYLFYLTGNDGIMHYAVTLAEHNSNIAKYLK